ncbi:AraC family transcriptional regulator [Myceligenerans pegani]|uniref:AraC family transcriptional regulator n=1 Tax=Myceligenerans pegani TaxID=2776917 RepID=A0ABR9N4E6_9MICO|nr:AraC family transcriptional regulator [Myceligenerans sp. TRM 65318]MBE1878540.1 AraC family transcriptional regulator [Myceligenerans sp. TRM 65318]MBE3020811.1 AraC family transcriptional regulator [Myceligenerans sp. TRM 65318]
MPLSELRGLLARHARTGQTTVMDGVRLCRFDRPAAPATSMSGTSLAIVAEGGKRLALGNQMHDYGPGQYLVTSADLPVTGQVLDSAGPTLGFGMTLEPAELTDLILDADLPPRPAGTRVIAVSDAPDELLDAVVRLLRLLDRPKDRKVLAPLIKREILWRLLTGDNGGAIQQIARSESTHIRRAIRWIRDNYSEPLKVEELAELAGLSVSAFHRNFRAVTSMSPIQFQKQIRLQEARLLLADSEYDVTTTGHQVGYVSASQFSREYRRQFGAPPSVDSARLRDRAATPALP